MQASPMTGDGQGPERTVQEYTGIWVDFMLVCLIAQNLFSMLLYSRDDRYPHSMFSRKQMDQVYIVGNTQTLVSPVVDRGHLDQVPCNGQSPKAPSAIAFNNSNFLFKKGNLQEVDARRIACNVLSTRLRPSRKCASSLE